MVEIYTRHKMQYLVYYKSENLVICSILLQFCQNDQIFTQCVCFPDCRTIPTEKWILIEFTSFLPVYSALIECHMDAGRRSDASHIATAAASFIKQNVSSLYKKVFGLMVNYTRLYLWYID